MTYPVLLVSPGVFSTTQKAYRWQQSICRDKGKYGTRTSGVVFIFYFICVIHSFIFFISYQVLSCINFGKLTDCQSVNRSDFKPGSGPGLSSECLVVT